MPVVEAFPVTLTTPRLRLRPLRASDAALISLHGSDARVARMTSSIPHPYPPGLAESYIERVTGETSAETAWALDAGSDGENGLIGCISLKAKAKAKAGAEAEIGYWVAPAYWGTGFASEAVEAIVARVAATGLTALTASVFQDNLASVKVLTRARFVFEGVGEVHCVSRAAMVATFNYRRVLAAL